MPAGEYVGDTSTEYDDISAISIHDKVQMIDISLNEVDGNQNDQEYEDEEVECEVKPDTSTAFIR